MNNAERCSLNTASACGTVWGRAAREALVFSEISGVTATIRISAGHFLRRAITLPSARTSETTNCPSSAAPRLSTWLSSLAADGVGERDPGNDRGGAAAQAAGNGNVIFNGEAHRRQIHIFTLRGVSHGAQDQIFLRVRRQVSAAGDAAGPRTTAYVRVTENRRAGGEVQIERQAQAIEPGT